MKYLKLKLLLQYLKGIPYLPAHLASSTDTLMNGMKAYINGIIDYVFYNELLGLRLESNIIVRLRERYFIVRRGSVDLNFISPLSELDEMNFLINILKRMKSKYKKVVFIDVGAHIRKYSIVLSEYSDKVIAIEPDPYNYLILKKNIEINKLTNIIPLNIAVYSHDTYLDFITLADYTAHSHIKHNNSCDSVTNIAGKAKTIRVKALTLDNIVRDLVTVYDSFFVLKIDVEGAEVEVLRGSTRTLDKTVALVVETSRSKLPGVLKLLPKSLLCTLKEYPSTLNLMCVSNRFIHHFKLKS